MNDVCTCIGEERCDVCAQLHRANLAGLVRRGRRDAVFGRNGGASFFPIDQPYNRSVEYLMWRKGYDHVLRLVARYN